MKKLVLTLSLLFAFNAFVIAQDPPDFEDDVDDTNVPIDGGVSLLAAAALTYGVRKIHNKNKDKSE